MNVRSAPKRAIRRTVRLALRDDRIRRLLASEMRVPPRPVPPPAFADADTTFTDRDGVVHPLDPQLRNRLKPGWRAMTDPDTASAPPTDQALRDRAAHADQVVAEAAALVEAALATPLRGRILEIGCYDGSAAFRLAARPDVSVVASDLARYYTSSKPGTIVDDDLSAQQVWLDTLRERARVVAGSPAGTVEFVEDDVTASSLEPASFDAIVSFEVLEHVADPVAAFGAMARLLRPGGLMYHDYNPFFSSIGGHSLATLDFPWGHARLDPSDVERYLREMRPAEAEQGLRFYRENLNRMSLAGLREAIAAAGLEIVVIEPWHDRRLVRQATAAILAEVRRTYPTVTLDDLLATFVSVVARRPSG